MAISYYKTTYKECQFVFAPVSLRLLLFPRLRTHHLIQTRILRITVCERHQSSGLIDVYQPFSIAHVCHIVQLLRRYLEQLVEIICLIRILVHYDNKLELTELF